MPSTKPRREEVMIDFLNAAGRKVKISKYHLEELQKHLVRDAHGSCVPVPVQAHFEGVIFSVIAADDQIAAAIRRMLGGRAGGETANKEQFQKLVVEVPELGAWQENAIYNDLRKVRDRAAHLSYVKGWERERLMVQEVGSGYRGCREIQHYSNAAVRHAEQLIELIPKVKSELLRRGSARGRQ